MEVSQESSTNKPIEHRGCPANQTAEKDVHSYRNWEMLLTLMRWWPRW